MAHQGYDLQLTRLRQPRLARDVLHHGDGALADERNGLHVGANALARGPGSGAGCPAPSGNNEGENGMNDAGLLDLTRRMERLERETRRWRIGAALVALSSCLLLLVGAGPAGVTEQVITRRLVVVDEAGQRRAELNVTNSVPALYLAGRDGVDRAWFEVAGDAPRLVFRDENKRQRLVLGGFSLHLDSGVTEVRSTSSLILMTENGKIWRAP